MSDTVLRIEKLEKSFGELQVLKGIDMEVRKTPGASGSTGRISWICASI